MKLPRALALAAAVTATALAGCGGGLYVGIDGDGWFDQSPTVNLVADRSSARPGQTVRLAAAASDDYYVAEVRFYRVDPNGGSTYLGADDRSPFDWDVTIPTDAVRGSSLRFSARAVDSIGQRSDGDTVTITVD